VLEWLIGLIASLLGVSSLAAVTLLVLASVGVSAVLRWHRSTRQDEYHYLNLTQQMHLAQTSGVPLDPFTLQSTEDPRLREAIQAMQSGGAPEAAPAQAAKRETRRGPRVVRRVPGRRA
jgi:hypothetical protein